MARTADKTDIPRRLAEAGYTLFNQLGYNATGIQQITEAAGVPKGSFYNHFDSKEAFAAQIIRNYAVWMGRRWEAIMADAPEDPLDALRHLFNAFIAHHEQASCPGCLVGNFAAEVSETSDTCRTELAHVMGQWRERLAELIERAQQAGRIRTDLPALTLSAFFWDSWEGAVLRMKVEHSAQPLKDAASLMLDTFFRP
ncbi:TetR family transcriptional regulator [Aquabacterium olei]|uniref:TetR family transcriptional regulator n=1 Tax=Aquabacterium olei TaxID=1296669 RepID=A0A2U8FU18_9BURK|nr:TetR/AcrR family transcriptional regulator [Aquabacterium olei]AWI53736.1 TetR family transcriptional regulator [Aquabacterium olei]